MRINILSAGQIIYTVTPDLCEVAKIKSRQERKAYDFVASDFSFGMKNGGELYRAIAREQELEIVVQDDTCVWFRGTPLYEGAGWTAGTGKHDLAWVSNAKIFTESWRNDTMDRIFWNTAKIEVDIMAASLNRATGCATYPSDFTENPMLTFYNAGTLLNDYSVFDFVKDCAIHQNAVFWVDEDNRLRLKKRGTHAAATAISSDLIFSFNDGLRTRDYDKILYASMYVYTAEELQSIVDEINMYLNRLFNEPNSQQWKDALKEATQRLDEKRNGVSGYVVSIEETLDNAKIYRKFPDNYDFTNCLDLRVPHFARGSEEKVSTTIFELRKYGSSTSDMRRGEWDALLKPKHINEIGLRGLTKYDPYTRIKILNIEGDIIETQYDLVKETTEITVETLTVAEGPLD